ncbi:MAG: cytochrome c biogenesis protein ResB [Opitutales bacterium]
MTTLFRIFGSLKLTVVLLALSTLVVLLGTLDQAVWGIYHAQAKYFESWGVFSPVVSLCSLVLFKTYPEHLEWLVIPLPGGLLLGTLLVLNLVCAHFRFFRHKWSRIGIVLTHGGMVLLIISGFLVSLLQKEFTMSLDEGEGPVWYMSAFRDYELALIDETDPARDAHYVIPSDDLKPGAFVEIPEVAMRVEVLAVSENVDFAAREDMQRSLQQQLTLGALDSYSQAAARDVIEKLQDRSNVYFGLGGEVLATVEPSTFRGIAGARDIVFHAMEPTYKLNESNYAGALVRLHHEDHMIGAWGLSPLFAENPQVSPQRFTHAGRTYRLELRFPRTYLPFSLALEDFVHRRHPGTETPAEFSSHVQLVNPQTGESRPVEISMNEPLRYGGYTFFQKSFANDDTTSGIQVVRNPSWLMPYISVGIIGLGLVVHFIIVLVRFLRRTEKAGARAAAEPAADVATKPISGKSAPSSSKAEPATV